MAAAQGGGMASLLMTNLGLLGFDIPQKEAAYHIAFNTFVFFSNLFKSGVLIINISAPPILAIFGSF